MTLKQTIREIFASNINYQFAQQVINQARSLDALSDDLYTDPIRFIYELIQNSDDAYEEHKEKNFLLRIAIVDRTYLIVAHYGKAFDEQDVRGLCNIGCGTKKTNSEKTGYKGLGFKAVFGQTDYVLIASKGEYFRFEANSKEFEWKTEWGKDQQTWEMTTGQKFTYPWQICPIWTLDNQIPISIKGWLFSQPEVVAYVVRLRDVNEAEESIKVFIKQPYVFMFLKRIKEIRISTDSRTETVFNISHLRDKSIKITSGNNQMISHWLLHTCQLDVPNEARNDRRLPEKFQNIKKIDLTLATEINNNDQFVQVRGTDSILFAYLPTKISTYNLPILVNTHFMINASREHICIDSPWNQWLFSSIPKATFGWIQSLTKDPKWKEKAYDLLPNRIPAKDALADSYNQACQTDVKIIPFLLGFNKTSLSIDEAVVDITLFSHPACIGHELIREYIVHTSSSRPRLARNPFVANNHRLRNLKIKLFTWEDCLQMLQSTFFLQSFKENHAIVLLQYIFDHRESTQIQKRLYDLPFLMDQYGRLRKLMEVYLPSRFSNVDWLMLEDMDSYVHPEVMEWLDSQLRVKNWLKSLGVREKTDFTFINEQIIPCVDRYITPENAYVTISRLFFLFLNSVLTTNQLGYLSRLKLFTLSGHLVPAYRLYFPMSYMPYLSIDHLDLDESFFVCPSYLENIEDVSVAQVKAFFQRLGVQDNIGIIQFDDSAHDELVAAYIAAQTKNLNYTMPSQFKNSYSIKFIEQTQYNYQFAIFFWEHVVHSINPRMLNEPEHLIVPQRRIPIINLPQWCVRTRSCIPTSTGSLLPSGEVFSNNLKILVGKYLPVFACNVPNPLPDLWRNFFGFKTQLSLDEHFILLDHIYHNSQSTMIDITEEDRIQNIYESLINILSRMDQAAAAKYKIPRPIYLISTRDNEFILSSELVLSMDVNLTLPSSVAQLKLNDTNVRHPNLRLLLKVIQVKQVTMDDLSLSDNMIAQFSLSLQSKLRNIQPYLFALAESKNINNHKIDYDLEIFEADQLELLFNKEIPIQRVPLHLTNNRLYVQRPWNSEQTMQSLPRTLCSIFKLPDTLNTDVQELLLAPTTRSVDESFQLRNIPIRPQFFQDDSLNIGGTREKFATQINRDNAKLFSSLQISSSTTAAELLLMSLNAQDSEWTGYVYHFTHLENAAQILREGKLKSRAHLQRDEFKDSAAERVIKATREAAKTHVRFYFRPLTPTQHCNENLGLSKLIERFGNRPMCPVPVFFRFDLRALLAIDNLQWKVSLGNIASSRTEFDCTKEIVEKFDFQYVYADCRTERGKYSSQHEFLIETELNFTQLSETAITLIVQDTNAEMSLKSLVPTIAYKLEIDNTYFFETNPQVLIRPSQSNPNKIKISIENEVESNDQSQLFVQSTPNQLMKVITGNLIGIFYHEEILTIMGKDRISFMPGSENFQYAVYYRYDGQMWLIFTNHSDAKYKQPPSE